MNINEEIGQRIKDRRIASFYFEISHLFYNLTGKQQCGVVNVLQTKKGGGQDIGKKKGRKQKPYILPPPIIRRKKKNAIRLCYRLLAPV